MLDFNVNDIEVVMKIVVGMVRNMGITIVDWWIKLIIGYII